MSVLKSIWWVESDYNIMAKRKGTKRQTVKRFEKNALKYWKLKIHKS
jgi:hypothetical protein